MNFKWSQSGSILPLGAKDRQEGRESEIHEANELAVDYMVDIKLRFSGQESGHKAAFARYLSDLAAMLLMLAKFENRATSLYPPCSSQ